MKAGVHGEPCREFELWELRSLSPYSVACRCEVNDVMSALQAGGVEQSALHSHLIGETPRLYFMHYWANDDAVKLARGLRAAINETNSGRPQ